MRLTVALNDLQVALGEFVTKEVEWLAEPDFPLQGLFVRLKMEAPWEVRASFFMELADQI